MEPVRLQSFPRDKWLNSVGRWPYKAGGLAHRIARARGVSGLGRPVTRAEGYNTHSYFNIYLKYALDYKYKYDRECLQREGKEEMPGKEGYKKFNNYIYHIKINLIFFLLIILKFLRLRKKNLEKMKLYQY